MELMKQIILSVLVMSLPLAVEPAPALASSGVGVVVKVEVNGLVCAFCAAGIEKTFQKIEAVDHVLVELGHKLVTIHLKVGQTLSDEKISELISNSGYSVVKITRG